MKKIKRLESELSKLSEVVKFLLHNDKDGISQWVETDIFFGRKQGIKFIKDDKVCKVSFPWYDYRAVEIVNNNSAQAIFTAYRPNSCSYFMLNKKEETIVEIPKPDFIKQENKQEDLTVKLPFKKGDYVWCVYYGVGGWKIAKHKIVGSTINYSGIHFIVNDTEYESDKFTTEETLGDKAFLKEEQAKKRAKELRTLGIKKGE